MFMLDEPGQFCDFVCFHQCDLPVVRTVLDQLGLHSSTSQQLTLQTISEATCGDSHPSNMVVQLTKGILTVSWCQTIICRVCVSLRVMPSKPALLISLDVRCDALSNKNLGV
jgi:hypothetical protein